MTTGAAPAHVLQAAGFKLCCGKCRKQCRCRVIEVDDSDPDVGYYATRPYCTEHREPIDEVEGVTR